MASMVERPWPRGLVLRNLELSESARSASMLVCMETASAAKKEVRLASNVKEESCFFKSCELFGKDDSWRQIG